MAGSTLDNGGSAPGAPGQTKLMADINITPMVDVMLVLLVIFMVTAPLLVAGVPVDLPRNSAQRVSHTKKPVVVTLAADGALYLRDDKVDAASLVDRLAALHSSEGDAVVYVRADKKVPYGEVMGLLGRLSTAGYQRISLLSQPANGGDEARPGAVPVQGGAPS